MPGERGEARSDRAGRDYRPPEPTVEQRARWRERGYDRFRDPDHQRWAQAHRTHDSLADAGRRGYQATSARHGRDFGARLLAAYRERHPSDAERALVAALDRLGQRAGADYHREYPVAPGRVYADAAWPARKLAVEVIGTAHEAAFFHAQGLVAREERRQAAYDELGWRVRVVTWRELRERPAETRERLRAMLAAPDGEQLPLWGDDEEARR